MVDESCTLCDDPVDQIIHAVLLRVFGAERPSFADACWDRGKHTLNSYVIVPLGLFLLTVNPWMQRHKFDKDAREPWRTLDDGLRST